MTVLRSRKVLPIVGRKTSRPVASENGVFEPVTPSKSLESGKHRVTESTTPISSSSAHEPVDSQLKLHCGGSSVMFLETGGARRRSARLATKLGISGCVDSIEVTSLKRKKVGSDYERNFCSSEADVRDLEGWVLDVDLGVNKSGQRMVQEDIGDVVVNQLIGDKDKVDCSGSIVESRLSYDSKTLGTKTVNNQKHKRKLSSEITLSGLVSGGNDGLEKGSLNLRSGKKVVKREAKGENGSDEKLESGKEDANVLVKNGSAANMVAYGNDGSRGRKFSRADKGKEKIGCEASVRSHSASANAVVGDKAPLAIGDSNSEASRSLKSLGSKEVVKDKGSRNESGTVVRRRLSKEEKGKMKLGGKGSPSNDNMKLEVKISTINSSISGSNPSAPSTLQNDVPVKETDAALDDARTTHRERFKKIARRIASRFANFSSQDELGDHAPDASASEIPRPEADTGPEDWPGPFSTAMKIIKDREMNRIGERQATPTNESKVAELKWIPLKQAQCKHPKQLIPSLQDLCLSVLAKNTDSVTSLDCVPDMLRHKICWFLCDSRRMNGDFLELLVHGSPTEIRLRDCSWLSEELFIKTFEGVTTNKLTVLQFDQCGACLPDYSLSATLTRSPNNLSALTTLSLKGAYRLTDEGLRMLVSYAPNLKSVDLSQCSMLTADGICSLADSLRLVLRELYIDNCHGIDAMLILSALLKLEILEVLSLAGFQTVSDNFVRKLVSVHGCRMKEIVLADCMELTDLSLEVIGENCAGLHSLDLTNINMTDVGICYLANGCREIQMLKFCRSALSDEAVAAYLDIRGASLKELSLNNVTKVSNNTALSLARNCRNLQSLDLSWCRNLTNEALGLIVDTCSSLELLKLFGCTQVTNVFLDGYSNPQVKLIGLKLTSVVQHIEVPDFLQGPLRYSSSST